MQGGASRGGQQEVSRLLSLREPVDDRKYPVRQGDTTGSPALGALGADALRRSLGHVLPADRPADGIGHIFTAEQWPEAHMRLFADWLRSHAEDRQRYAGLEQALLAEGLWDASYTVGKAEFVRGTVNRARRERGLPPVVGVL